MNEPKKRFPSLAEIEREVIAECQEWGRKRLEERLQKLADEQGEAFPPPATKTSKAKPAHRTGKSKSKR